MSCRAGAAVAAAVVALAGAGSGRAQSAARDRAAWNRPVEPFRIVGPVYYVGVAGVGSYLVTTAEGHFLIDGGLPETAPLIERSITRLGFRLRDVKYILNSHAHFDHAGGLAALHRDTGAAVVISGPDARTIETGGASMPAVEVARRVQDGERLTLGGITLTARLTPGHTPGCTTWALDLPHSPAPLHVLFFCSTSVVAPLVHNAAYPNIVADYRRSFALLKQMPCDVFLASHPFFFHMEEKLAERKPGGPNPFIDPGEFQRYVAESEAEFEKELKRQTAERR